MLQADNERMAQELWDLAARTEVAKRERQAERAKRERHAQQLAEITMFLQNWASERCTCADVRSSAAASCI